MLAWAFAIEHRAADEPPHDSRPTTHDYSNGNDTTAPCSIERKIASVSSM